MGKFFFLSVLGQKLTFWVLISLNLLNMHMWALQCVPSQCQQEILGRRQEVPGAGMRRGVTFCCCTTKWCPLGRAMESQWLHHCIDQLPTLK